MKEREIRKIIEEHFSVMTLPDGDSADEELDKCAKALHQKIEETTFATVEQIEKSGWVSPDSLEKTCSDLVDQHLEAEEKLKHDHKQAMIDARIEELGKLMNDLSGNKINITFVGLMERISQLKKERKKMLSEYIRKQKQKESIERWKQRKKDKEMIEARKHRMVIFGDYEDRLV